MKQRIHDIRACVRQSRPLVHCITNPISIHQCANALLAVGARPVMAEHPGEVREITKTAAALLLNLGNITDARMESMLISAEAARAKGIPVIVDAVGAACSSLRKDFAYKLFDVAAPAVIKGNYSEIHALFHRSYRSTGVDADSSLSAEAAGEAAAALSEMHSTTVLASGKTDLIADGSQLVRVGNGTPMLSSVTGTGCMLGALCAAYLTAGSGTEAAVSACAVLGICGQLAQTNQGSGSFMVFLMDALSTLADADIDKYLEVTKNDKT